VQDFPSNVRVTWGAMQEKEGQWSPEGKPQTFSLPMEKPTFGKGGPISINTLSREALMNFGLPFGLAEEIRSETLQNGPFKGQQDFLKRMQSRYKIVDFMDASHWGKVQEIMFSKNLTF